MVGLRPALHIGLMVRGNVFLMALTAVVFSGFNINRPVEFSHREQDFWYLGDSVVLKLVRACTMDSDHLDWLV